jgi:hypothetical protein
VKVEENRRLGAHAGGAPRRDFEPASAAVLQQSPGDSTPAVPLPHASDGDHSPESLLAGTACRPRRSPAAGRGPFAISAGAPTSAPAAPVSVHRTPAVSSQRPGLVPLTGGQLIGVFHRAALVRKLRRQAQGISTLAHHLAPVAMCSAGVAQTRKRTATEGVLHRAAGEIGNHGWRVAEWFTPAVTIRIPKRRRSKPPRAQQQQLQ